MWKGIAQDALVMNTDDLACIGATQNFLCNNTIGRNIHHIPSEVIAAVIEGMEAFCQRMRDMGINIHMAGGETADVGDLVRNIIVDASAAVRLKKTNLIQARRIAKGDLIVGLASFGQAKYEDEYNSGMGSNGFGLARHALLKKMYATKYPESFDPNITQHAYTGKYLLTDTPKPGYPSIGKMLLSPTRTYLPILKEAIAKHAKDIHGIIHCTGSGTTKVLRFLKNVKIIKDKLLSLIHI